MKYLKLFEKFNVSEKNDLKENIDLNVDDWDWDEEEEDKPKIPIGISSSYDAKDLMRINNILRRSTNHNHSIRLSRSMANRIKHIDKAWRRGFAAKSINEDDIAEVFFNRARELSR